MALVRCEECRLRVKSCFRQFSRSELKFISGLKSGQISLPPKAPISVPGERSGKLYTLFAGWAFRYRIFPNGRRQITDFLLPGDLIGLQAQIMGTGPFGVEALTAVTLCELGGRPLSDLFKEFPGLSESMVRTLVRDQRRNDDLMGFLGRRTAAQRMANLMLEIFDRLDRLGMSNGTWCQFPLQRRHLADALGLSGAHVNRSAADLQDAGLATLGNNVLVLLDRSGLEKFAGYSLLNMEERLIL